MEDIRGQVDRKFIARARSHILDGAKNIKSNDKTFGLSSLPEFLEDFDKLADIYLECIKTVQASETAYMTILNNVDAALDADGEEFVEVKPILKEFEALTNQEREKLSNVERDFISELNKIIRPQEQETRQTENRSAQSIKDPITKQDIKVPVQSSKCKHVFEKETIENYLAQSKKCPQAGCTNKRMTVRELVSFNVQESSPIIIS